MNANELHARDIYDLGKRFAEPLSTMPLEEALARLSAREIAALVWSLGRQAQRGDAILTGHATPVRSIVGNAIASIKVDE